MTTTHPVSPAASRPSVARRRPALTAVRRQRVRAAGVAGSVLAACAVWAAGRALGADFRLADSMGEAVINLPVVAVFSLLFALLGWGTLALLERFTRHARTAWTTLAITVLLLSVLPIFAEQATTATRIALCLVHGAVAAVLVPVLRRSAR
ncbi:DUF6069 family protein [Streptomyces sp. H10-C2]|uniref:DUF6069 family protein n=1 Tax=unclassified Streptomyces TaxID=2593676 RepID=UPI0024B938AE|nr:MULTISPECIES: DUF6069 family protein [unclassified Streptomyces]MDJ0342912.1 DUF6069 family protein [Streptomyces sp. PH10-H1]MDJ0372686.1 DUF6069 family protein [Streptomyces sp. H10-C2]